MARTDNEIKVTLSVLDRLLDYDPQATQEPPKSRSASLRQLKQSVRRDLEWLLNTRRFNNGADDELSETIKSVTCYGLPDFTGIGAKNSIEQKRLTRLLEAALKNFEPRLADVNVSLEPIDDYQRQLRFRIEARLLIEPTPEPITFDTMLEVGSGEFSVQER